MRYMFLIKTDPDSTEAMPPPAMMEAMYDMALREVQAGRMLVDGGLAPRAVGGEMRIRRGKLTTDGPFAETKEVVGGFAIFELPDLDAAMESARAFMQLHVDHMPGWEGVCEVRPVAGSMVETVRAGG